MAGRTSKSEILAASKRSRDGRNPQLSRLVTALLGWFSANARDLPWRRTRDPYAIWVSEIMLQQTQVKTVIPYWKRWMRELSTIEAVAAAGLDKIHKLWEGLGYYTRARNLQKAARQIVEKHDGKFPDNFDDVLALPGIGRYTAGAICSIAFNQPKPILDGNVIRVLTRIFGIAGNLEEKATNKRLWEVAADLVSHASRITYHVSRPKSRTSRLRYTSPRQGTRTMDADDSACSRLNQSLMELGALVCTPRNPLCPVCPVKKLCVAFRENRVGELPNPGRRPTATARRFIAFVVERAGKFLVRQRPAGGVNAHLWEFPNVEIGPRLSGPQRVQSQNAARRITATDSIRTCCGSGDPRSEAAVSVLGFRPTKLTPFCTIKHSITRYRNTLEAFATSLKRVPSGAPGVWRTPAQMRQLAFPSAHKKILDSLVALRNDVVAPASRGSFRASRPKHQRKT